MIWCETQIPKIYRILWRAASLQVEQLQAEQAGS